ncbi:MAG: response regulator [Anaerolineae bacterium]
MPRRVLIVDDDPDALRLVSYAFQAEGFQVSTASGGAEALALLRDSRPDLVVLDVMMPDMSGIEVCQHIRANRHTARLPVLMLSARGQVADRISGLKAGADDYLPKPADTSELIARAEALIARANSAPPPLGRVLAFLGAKGGTGTTTVAINVAAALLAQGKSVCLAELRPSVGTAALLLKLRPLVDLGNLCPLNPADLSWDDVQGQLLPHASGLRLLPAPQSANHACDISEGLVEALVSYLAQGADYVLLDLPASWTAANRAAVRRAFVTAVTCEPDAIGVHCARATLGALQQWGIMGDLVGLVVVNRGHTPTPNCHRCAPRLRPVF